MLLAVDIGNTNIKLGIFDGKELLYQSRLSTDTLKTQDEYAVELISIFSLYNINLEDFEGSIISSVVPVVTSPMANSLNKVIGKKPLIVGPGIKTGLNIKIDDPTSLGADLVVSGVAISEMYPLPAIVISMGTATTITVIDEKKTYIGGSIAPGVSISMEALSKKGALLPSVGLDMPKKAIATNTVDSIRSGIVLGTTCMIDGMIDKFEDEFGKMNSIVATGGISSHIVHNCSHKIELKDDLFLQGLRIIYNKNKTI